MNSEQWTVNSGIVQDYRVNTSQAVLESPFDKLRMTQGLGMLIIIGLAGHVITVPQTGVSAPPYIYSVSWIPTFAGMTREGAGMITSLHNDMSLHCSLSTNHCTLPCILAS